MTVIRLATFRSLVAVLLLVPLGAPELNKEHENTQAAGFMDDKKKQRAEQPSAVAENNDPAAVEPVRQYSPYRSDQKNRYELGSRHDSQPGCGMGQFPDQPGHRHQLNPVSGKRQHIADRKQRKIPVAEQLPNG